MVAVLLCAELALLTPMGMASYRFIERPFLNRKRARRSGSPRPTTTLAPTAAPAEG
jgi:peptidoglycan/LPS O-acetylase OafA/YrhL